MNCADARPELNAEIVASILGESRLRLMTVISQRAEDATLRSFLIGGVVRDLIMGRRNLDLDFVVEGDAVAFAKSLAQAFGGTMQSHPPFGTAKWTLDASAAAKLQLDKALMDAQIDFAMAREELYERPAALPTVSPSSIERDMARRDFSINTMAIQMSPVSSRWRIVDPLGGRNDIHLKLIRALHDKSFVDDPTRIFRALRLAVRLGFELEAQTERQLKASVAKISLLSGERIRNEIQLILLEEAPERVIEMLDAYGVWSVIDSRWKPSAILNVTVGRCRDNLSTGPVQAAQLQDVYWHLLMVELPVKDVVAICNRLALPQGLSNSLMLFARLMENRDLLYESSTRPSQVTRLLDNLPDAALRAVWICLHNAQLARERIEAYVSVWQSVRPLTDGNELMRRGLQPGPHFRNILDALRAAWIDDDVQSEAEEQAFLQKLLAGAGLQTPDDAKL